MVRPYDERRHRDAIALLRAEVLPCWHGCGRRATVPDHVPALAEHYHVEGSECCQLRPSCAPCNAYAGAVLGNRRLRERRGLAAGTGTIR